MLGIRWQWWVIVSSALLLVAAPPTRDMLKMQAAGINPKADYYLWYPLWSSDKDLLKMKSIYRFVLRSDATSPMAGAARRLQRRAERRPRDFLAGWGAVAFMPQQTSDPATDDSRQAQAAAARRLAARFPDRQEVLLLWVRAEIDALPSRRDWYRPDTELSPGEPGTVDHSTRLLSEAQAAPAVQAVETGMQRFPNNAYWLVSLAGIYFRMGNDTDALSALKAATRKPYIDIAHADTWKLSVRAAREAGLSFPEALEAHSPSALDPIIDTAQVLQVLVEGAPKHGQGREAAEYCIAGTEVGDLTRRTARSLGQAIVGVTFTSKSGSAVAAKLPESEAGGRELVPGMGRSAEQGRAWYKGPSYDFLVEQAGQAGAYRVINHLYAARAMADAIGSYRGSRNSSAEVERYSRDGILSWYLMVAGVGLLALAASLLVVFLPVHLIWIALRRPQGGMGTGWQAVVLPFSFAVSGAIATLLAARAGVVALTPVLSRTVWVFPVALIVVLGVAARVQTRSLLSPERGTDRCGVGMLHQILPNALLVVVLVYLALAVPTAVIRHQMTSAALAYVTGDKSAHFREEMGWDEAKVRYPFPIGRSRRSSPIR
jgi:hypothetical protein